MDFATLSTTFDFFATCYLYGSIGYVLIRFLFHLILCFSALVDDIQTYKTAKPDFYQEVKELLNPGYSSEFIPPLQPSFETMTIRELRTFIRDNELQESVYTCLGKTVSDARKHELIQALS